MLLHHLFLQLIDDFGQQTVAKGHYSIEFLAEGVFLHFYLHFLHGDQLARVYLKRAGRTKGQRHAELVLLSNLIAAISTKPGIVCCRGSTSQLVQLLEDCSPFQHGVQSPYRIDILSVQSLKHKRSYSLFGHIDFFCVLKCLVISISGCMILEGNMLTPELTKD